MVISENITSSRVIISPTFQISGYYGFGPDAVSAAAAAAAAAAARQGLRFT